MSKALRPRAFYVNQAGTRYIRDEAKPVPPKEKPYTPSKELLPFLKGEAEGDLLLAVVMAVRNLIRLPSAYVQTVRACNSNGQSTDPTSPEAVRWNIFGALEYITYPNFTRVQKQEVLNLIKQNLPAEWRTRLFLWEEERNTTHSQVINLLNQSVGARKRALESK